MELSHLRSLQQKELSDIKRALLADQQAHFQKFESQKAEFLKAVNMNMKVLDSLVAQVTRNQQQDPPLKSGSDVVSLTLTDE